MKSRMGYFPEKNPNPVLSVEKNGTVLYSNEAGKPLLNEWGVKVGGKLPSYIEDLVHTVISRNNPEKLEIKAGSSTYLLSFHPLLEDECVNIYGFDITDRKKLEERLRDSEKRERARSDELAAVLDAVPVAVFMSSDPKVLKITGNRLACEWVQLPVGANFSKSAPEGERPETFKLFKDGVEMLPAEMPSQIAAAGIEVNDCELDIVTDEGKIRHLLGNARPLRDEQGNLRGSISAFIDITERKKAEDALKKIHDSLEEKVKERTNELDQAYISLKESEKGLAEAQKIAHIGSWEQNFAVNKLHWSNEMFRIFGLKPQEFEVNYGLFLNYVHPDDRDSVENAFKEALKGKPFNTDFRIIPAHGDERIVHGKGGVIFDDNKNPVRIRGTTQDITERRTAEEKIQYLANVVESSTDAIVTVSLDRNVTSWNKGAEQIFGYAAEEILGKKVSILEPDNLKGDIKQFVEQVKKGKKIKYYESSRLKKDGTTIIISGTLFPVLDTSGKTVAISVIARDITESKRTEEAIKCLEIARKKEIHHRIKNNLQVISSLLDLQADNIKYKKNVKKSEFLEAFRESQDRVISMALIHEELHKSEDTDVLNFTHYIEELADNLFLTYKIGNENINFNKDIEEDIFFNIDVSIPLGLILNELISNSFKYAFPNKDSGEIRVALYRESGIREIENTNTAYVLSVSDNGVGISEDLDIENPDSLGLQLVTTLVEQLDGELVLKRDNGTEFIIRFSVAEN